MTYIRRKRFSIGTFFLLNRPKRQILNLFTYQISFANSCKTCMNIDEFVRQPFTLHKCTLTY